MPKDRSHSAYIWRTTSQIVIKLGMAALQQFTVSRDVCFTLTFFTCKCVDVAPHILLYQFEFTAVEGICQQHTY